MIKPLAIDLFSGLGGWTEGLLAENYRVIGFDIERHEYGDHKYPAQLVLQDVRTLHGSQFQEADLIVASPPCQEFSYMAMPWSRAKAKAEAIRADATGEMRRKLTELFDACFRIQREACEAAGRHIPMVVENVRGAEKWVGKARWNYRSFYLWGDVPALMPMTTKRRFKFPAPCGPRLWKDRESPRLADGSISSEAHAMHMRISEKSGCGNNPDGRKGQGPRNHGSKSKSRKAASAMIAKIPFALARYIAKVYKPEHAR